MTKTYQLTEEQRGFATLRYAFTPVGLYEEARYNVWDADGFLIVHAQPRATARRMAENRGWVVVEGK